MQTQTENDTIPAPPPVRTPFTFDTFPKGCVWLRQRRELVNPSIQGERLNMVISIGKYGVELPCGDMNLHVDFDQLAKEAEYTRDFVTWYPCYQE